MLSNLLRTTKIANTRNQIHVCMSEIYLQYPHEAGRKLPWGNVIRHFTSIELECAARQPGPSVRVLCELVALLSKNTNTTCVPPLCNATPSENCRPTSHCLLQTMHFANRTSFHLKPHFQLFTHGKLLHQKNFTPRNFCGQKHTEVFLSKTAWPQ